MKKLYTFITLVILTSATFKASAQSDNGISDLFKGSPGDVNKLINAYSNPLFKGFGNSLNGGWTNTAKTQSLLHFVVRVSATASMVPSSDKTFDINSLNLDNIKPSGSSIAPTFGGDKNLSTGIVVSDPSAPNDPTRKYNTTLPKGVSQYIPAPQVQLTIGLIKSTDFTVRFIPTTKITNDVGSVGMFGFGLKHNFANDFGAKHVLPFDLALAVGYTRLNYTKPLSVQPDAGSTVGGNTDFTNQSLEGHFSGWNTQIILSKKLLFFTPFVSVGYLSSKTDVGLKGNFPFVTGVTNTGKPIYTSYANPISITGSAASVNGARADVGFQMSLFFFKLYGSYSFAAYQSVNAGIGLGF
ncbi:DUF6588 family protein [Mucilaginibacter sp. UR6-11]|uniref:DUF6588 family protein n=1 Tax=Mucilaginibacter sp. UR6-11 TaxID=1435644 RepID=UPI001E340E4D|nr:DUF6588 family protein [Mucilaginibacter sp. UR6-11]MCC8423851.1 hypothetical protein [Mucilaginibacter sp. UR6-11]